VNNLRCCSVGLLAGAMSLGLLGCGGQAGADSIVTGNGATATFDGARVGDGDSAATVTSATDGATGTNVGDAVAGETFGDDSGSDAPEAGFPEWIDPTCKMTGGKCTDPACRPAKLLVAPNDCSPGVWITAGCVRFDRPSPGGQCWHRQSDGMVIMSSDQPIETTDLIDCHAVPPPPCDGGSD
jgi:hypothetical protein